MTTLSEQKAIIRKHQNVWPVHVVPIASALGIQVYRRSDWPNNISGRIYRTPLSGYSIDVNANHHENRRRYTISHEIGHFVLHRHLIGDELFDDGLYRSGLSSRVERQADDFASGILMPDHLISKALLRYGRDPDEMAKAFRVSPQAMKIRLGLSRMY